MKHIKLYALIFFVASFILCMVSMFVLPDTVITQLQAGGGKSTMPKLFALALPTLLGGGFSAACLLGKEDGSQGNSRKPKWLLISAIGVVIFIVMLVVNLA